MSEKFEVISEGQEIPTAVNLGLEDAEYVDFNLAVLSAPAPSRRRRNPASSVASVDAQIADLIQSDAAPKSLKLAKKAANALGLGRREVSEIVQQLGALYKTRDILLFPEFADAVSRSLADDLSRNQGFFLAEGLVAKVIECQASAFRNSVALGAGASYERLTSSEKDFLQDLLLLLEVFVGVDENAEHFVQDSTFFDSLGSLTKDQLRALCDATENVEFENMVGAHYSPYVMLTLQALFSQDSKLTIQALSSRKSDKAQNLYEFLGSLDWDASLGRFNRVFFEEIATGLQGTGVDSKTMNVCLHIFMGTQVDDSELLKILRKSKVFSEDQKVSSSPVMNAFLYAKAINFTTTDIKIRDRNLANAYALKPAKAFASLNKTIKAPPSISSPFIWGNFVSMDEIYADNETHYLDWGFQLFNAAYKAGVPNYDNDPRYENDKALCTHLGSKSGRKDLETLIAFCEQHRKEEGPAGRNAMNLIFNLGGVGAIPGNSKRSRVPLNLTGYTDAQDKVLESFRDLSIQSLALNLLLGSLAIKDAYNLRRLKYELVDVGDAVVALSVPYNPLELMSGYRTLGACCMLPFQPGTYASMSSFYGNISDFTSHDTPIEQADRTAYVFAPTEKGHICLGTMFLPRFSLSYDSTSPQAQTASIELYAGPTAIQVRTEGIAQPYPEAARSFDGWETTSSTDGVDANVVSQAAKLLVEGVLGAQTGVQMGLTGSVGNAPQTSIKSVNDVSVRATSISGSYLDYSSPSPNEILKGIFTVENPCVLFDQVIFTLDDPRSKTFSMAYRALNGAEVAVKDPVSWDYMRYMWSFPKMHNFIPMKGSAVFRVDPSDYNAAVQEALMDLVEPEWFLGCDSKPLIRGDRKLKTADILEMRRPLDGISLEIGSKSEYITDPK